MGAQRWLGVGQAGGAEPEPGARAAGSALRHADAKLLVVFCSASLDLPAVLRQVNERSGGVPLIGCSTSGEIAPSGPDVRSVVVTAFGGDGFSIRTAAAAPASDDLRAAGASVARCLARIEERPYRVLLLLTDGLAGDQREILRGVYRVLGSGVPLVGGCAGDVRMAQTFQLHGDRVLTDSVVAAGIGSDAPLGIGVRHGWRRVGEPMLVTGSGGNRVHTLDGQPALDVYLDRLGAPAAAYTSHEELARLALVHPLGLGRRAGEEEIRFIVGGDFGDRSLACIAEVPQAALVWLMEGDVESVRWAGGAACTDALEALGGRPPLGVLAFECVGRRPVLGEEGIRVEIDEIVKCCGGAPVAGCYTYGEIARRQGVIGFHNQTLVLLSVA
ncbi:FIST signal transduction protein [Pseudonocardia adelaidensis]|uniref:FIST N-terminal domain-containing protein n=1 Tax=Pseudonocardia adelaidensis TaxID=648754 RepID=A0ABP9NCA4_9PSEU